jgi:peptidoglycan/LPS O-acetylase OafA/YrhL
MSEAPPAPPAPPEARAPKAKLPWWALEPLDNRYPVLHGMRVLAILSVIQYHVTWIFWGEQGIGLDEDFREASISIFYGMDLFFVLSGFLIGAILLRSLDTSGTQNLRRFYIRRIFRTFPSYYLVLTFLVLITPLTAQQSAHLIYEYVYLTNFMPLARHEILMFWGWSLSLEEQFYLAVPLLMWLLFRLKTDRARMIALGVLIALPLVTRWVIYLRVPVWTDYALYDALYFRTHTRYDPIVAGILLAFAEIRYGERIAAFLRHPLHRAVLAIFAMTCWWIASSHELFGEENAQVVRIFAWGTLTSLMYLALVPLMLHGDGVIQRFLSQPIFRRLATVGYGVYLVHIPLLDAFFVPLARRLRDARVPMIVVWPATLAAVVASSLGLAYVLHVAIEKPALRVRDRLTG